VEVPAHAIDDLSPRRQHSERRECPGIDHGCSVDQYPEFAVVSVNHVNIDL
jgi:hypothetical protein